jgi:predicted MFS family arabinose efflux permease
MLSPLPAIIFSDGKYHFSVLYHIPKMNYDINENHFQGGGYLTKTLIGGIFSLIIAMGIGRFAYTPILPLMQNDLSFSNALAGYLATSNYAGYLLGAILAGANPFKNCRLVQMRRNLIISILTTALMGLCSTYLSWMILRFISGLASAFVFVSASSMVLDTLAIKNKTDWSGLFYSGVGLGILISSLMIPILNNLFSWKGVWVGLALVCAILAFFIWMWLKAPDDRFDKEHHLELKTKGPPATWFPWLISAYGLEGLGYIVTGTFIVSIAQKTSIFSSNPILVWTAVGLAATPSCLFWSSLAKKWGFVKTLVSAMALQAIGIALPLIWISKISFILSALLFGATFMGITTLATTLARQIRPTDSSRAIGYLTATYAVGQMIGPTIAGSLASYTQSFDYPLMGAAIAVLIGSVFLLSGIKYERTGQ